MTNVTTQDAALATRRLHPLPVRLMHWTNAVAMLVMIASGWGIYDDYVIISGLHFGQALRLGNWAAESLLWHFAGMWLLALNGLLYLIYGLLTGRFRERLFPIKVAEVVQTVRDTLHLRIAHDDLTKYNAVQKLLYIVVIVAGMSQVVTGLAIWKPIQFSPQNYAAYVDQLKQRGDTSAGAVAVAGNALLDNAYKDVQNDLSLSGNVLGIGWNNIDTVRKMQALAAQLATSDSLQAGKIRQAIAALDKKEKITFRAFRWSTPIGWLLTAMAISLGAPFWFDLLNKLVKLRAAGGKPEDSTGKEKDKSKTTANTSAAIIAPSPIQRKG